MAGRGPAPKPGAVRRNKEPEKTKLVAGDEPRGPELPDDVLPITDTLVQDGKEVIVREEWHPQTRRWWDSWRTSPQASRMLSGPDWDFLLDTALMHHVMWSRQKWEFASEVRLRVAKFGATPEDRLRLRVEIETPEEAPVGEASATVTSISDRRRRLTEGG
ncbi:phage terminase small subunit [Puerhibacterium puerhi]|uniref:phage terminase small subunit n=1 Tax=Puerhibacterium puerhi TaxID=2692623 RepID=UPI001915C2AC|nr:hypothetical protein [Puerhibacterium puerhi]